MEKSRLSYPAEECRLVSYLTQEDPRDESMDSGLVPVFGTRSTRSPADRLPRAYKSAGVSEVFSVNY